MTPARPIFIARQAGLLFLYAAALSLSLWFSYLLRFDFSPTPEYLAHFGTVLFVIVATKLTLLVFFGQFGSLLSYFSTHDAGKILTSCAVAAACAFGFWFYTGISYAPPRAVILTDFLISFIALCGLRFGFRLLREGYFQETSSPVKSRRYVGIIGAGNVGASLAKELSARRGLGMQPVAFFDDDNAKWRTTIHGIPVKGPPELIPRIAKDGRLDKIVIALPRAAPKRIQEIVGILNKAKLKFEIVPSLEELITGKVHVSQIRPVDIEDLLGRPMVDLETDKIRQLISDRVILVTGAGGSIGSEICRQIVSYHPRLLILVERCEVQLFQIEQEILSLGYEAPICCLVADILDQRRMFEIFGRFNPHTVFHAAAHKHVPLMEGQPEEAFRNNSVGTRIMAELSAASGVQSFVFISTDKAINPTSVMGATKRLAELFLQAFQSHAHKTNFMAVRFGNVLGSSGSVIPTFKRQIANGGPITVTHPDITRYFMTVREAVGLVLQTATIGLRGEIFVLDMGKPIKIVDVARQLIELSGLTPEEDIQIQFTGLRPGEKLYEELNHTSENFAPTIHSKIFRLVATPQLLDRVISNFESIERDIGIKTAEEIKLGIRNAVPEYSPYMPSI